MKRNFAKRDVKEFNCFRAIFQRFMSDWCYGMYLKLLFNFKVEGKESIDKNARFIVAGNHISGIDPFAISCAIKRPIAFMAKKELFEKFYTRIIMDWCGAFAVDREKLEIATFKTALSIKNTNWILGLFPQGTRAQVDVIENVNKGFATLAKASKTDILPVAVIGTDNKIGIPFFNKKNVTIKIGKVIPYSDDIDNMISQWCVAMNDLLNVPVL